MKNIGIFYPGEMGGVLCKKLVENDFLVYSSVSERSPKTRQTAIQNGAILKDTIEDVILSSDIIFSLVPPSCAISLATDYINICSSMKKNQIFIDCNSVSPSTVLEIANILNKDSIDFVDGAFIGSSNLIDTKTKLFLCGHRAVEVAKLLKGTIEISAISSQIGKASELKMCFAGFNKSLIALFLEFAYASIKAGNWQDLSLCLNDFYPGTMQTIRRLLPSYPKHVRRRVDEIKELCNYLEDNSQTPSISRGAQFVLEAFNSSLNKTTAESLMSKETDIEDILLYCVQNRILDTNHHG